ncbi:sel1 repeat family protein [Vibrio sp. Isolate25]|uniref:tetratricopeptide repeat protein n=1 Tax=Vibrio sp. Isolate25 TaxID=2908535 RepID=UPI001EFCE76B|nr:tetratricopeptide repeat protein [Vibrio sp. Isolate25]MCG9596197.1 sel1 repeat family protein [Vibrio sp. Isolate25]
MNVIGIAIGATGLLLLCLFMWMLALQLRKKRLEQERKEREVAYRKAMEKNRKQEQEERVYKAENGHVPTILFLAKEAERSRPKEALYWYNKAARLDNVNGMYGVVRISNKMNQDLVLREEAKFWQTCIPAMEGSIPHKFEMALALFYGRGTEQNIGKAIQVMKQAAEQNYLDALIFLGDWFASAHNPEPNPRLSTEYYQQAASQRSNEGRMKLGLNYIRGIGVTANFSRGCYWLERAAEKGYTDAMYSAGEAWMDQRPNGNSIAYIWLFLAGQLGHEQARILRDQVALSIGVDTVVGLQSLSKPILKKIRDNKVSKHAVIKALNKLYKRNIPLQEQDVLGEEEIELDLVSEVPPIVEESVEAVPSESEVKEKLDFSQSNIDKA